MARRASERRYLGTEEPGELEAASAKGSFLFDAHGKKYVDFVMGWCVGNLGWGHAAITKRIRRFSGPRVEDHRENGRRARIGHPARVRMNWLRA